MGDEKNKDELPGDKGQFGADVETEDYETLPEPPGVETPGTPAGTERDDDEAAKTPGQHQEQGGMRS